MECRFRTRLIFNLGPDCRKDYRGLSNYRIVTVRSREPNLTLRDDKQLILR